MDYHKGIVGVKTDNVYSFGLRPVNWIKFEFESPWEIVEFSESIKVKEYGGDPLNSNSIDPLFKSPDI